MGRQPLCKAAYTVPWYKAFSWATGDILPNILPNTSLIMSSQETEEPEATRTVSLPSWSVPAVPALSALGQFAPVVHGWQPHPTSCGNGSGSMGNVFIHGRIQVLFNPLFSCKDTVTPPSKSKTVQIFCPSWLSLQWQRTQLFITPRGQIFILPVSASVCARLVWQQDFVLNMRLPP